MKPTHEQQLVIDSTKGVVLVTACPGSGKTATLVQRTIALPASESKLALAFNKKAADEFEARLSKHAVSNAQVKTFHSLCFREINAHPLRYGYRSKPGLAQESLFRQMIRATGIEAYSWDETPWDEDLIKEAENSLYDADLRNLILDHRPKHSKGSFIDDEQERRIEEQNRAITETCKALLQYREWLLANNLITFSEMIRLVAEKRHLLAKLADHIMVDEFQDVDRFQYDIISAAARHTNVKSFVVVGDPNQRIYEWRGALVNSFARVQEDFPACTVRKLTTNFRSTPQIVAHAETICPTGMAALREAGAEVCTTIDAVTDVVLMYQQRKASSLSNIAVLSRYNRVCMQMQLDLVRQGVPTFLLGKKDFWKMPHIQLARRARDNGYTPMELFASRDWQKLLSARRFQDDPKLVEEVSADAEWILTLSKKDLETVEGAIDREDIGVRISTIHKTKGMEWDTVVIAKADDKLQADTFVWYVACTRAKDLLVINYQAK